jgi:hypothetical protein
MAVEWAAGKGGVFGWVGHKRKKGFLNLQLICEICLGFGN